MSTRYLKIFLVPAILLLLSCCRSGLFSPTFAHQPENAILSCQDQEIPDGGSLEELKYKAPEKPTAFVDGSESLIRILSNEKDGKISCYGKNSNENGFRSASFILITESLSTLYRGIPRTETAPFHVETSNSYYVIALMDIRC